LARPSRGIGRTTIERAVALADEAQLTLLEGLRRMGEQGGGRTGPKIRDFLDLIDVLQEETRGCTSSETLALTLQRSGYVKALEKDGSPEAEGRLENLRELISAAEDFGRELDGEEDEVSEMERFLDQVALVSDIDAWNDRDECVSLMTVHTAKGLEFPVVFVVGLEEGVFPHSGSMRDEVGIEEERRLCYVAMTRAMEELTLTSARERLRYGSRTYGVASRFLREIPEDALAASARSQRESDSSLDYSYAQDAPGDVDDGDLAPGLRVRHPIFGPGTVLEVVGHGGGQKLRIKFERAGVKTIVVRYANLELG
jgi:DNA helicase-2/ATP-dependent DNA helicase PcrA